MEMLEKFFEFVRKNPPPCLPGESLYFFNSESGAIVCDDKNPVSRIAVDTDGNWLVAYEDDENSFYKVNESELDCSSYEIAKKFRDEIGSVKYALFIPSDEVHFEYNSQGYNSLTVKEIFVKDMKKEDTYIEAIMRQDCMIKPGMIVRIFSDCNTHFLISEDKEYESIYGFKAIDLVGETYINNISN